MKKIENKKLLLSMLLSLSASLTNPAFANMQLNAKTKMPPGGLVGNGGGTVVCRNTDHSIKSVELLDYYESFEHTGMQIDVQTIPGDWKAKTAGLINRVRAKSELHYQIYSRWLANFESEMRVLDGVEMSTVPDAGYVAVPQGCEFEQAAVQRKPIAPNDPRYYLNGELWNAMDDNQKAGLVMHEITYREAIAYGHTDSIRTRYLNGVVASTQFAAMSFFDYVKLLDEMHFELVDVPVESAFKGLITSKFNFARLWQAGPDDKSVPALMTIADTYVARVGECVAPDCSNFTSYRLLSNLLSGSEATSNQIHFPKDVYSMMFGETYASGGMGQAMEGVILNADIVSAGSKFPNTIDLFSNDQSLGVLNQNWGVAGGLHINFIQSSPTQLNWVSVEGSILESKNKGALGLMQAVTLQECALFVSTFNPKVYPAVISKIYPAVNRNLPQCPDYSGPEAIEIESVLPNGVGRATLPAVEGNVFDFDLQHPGQLLSSKHSEWVNNNDHPVTSVSCNAFTKNDPNCISYDETDQAVQSLSILDVGTPQAYFCAQMAPLVGRCTYYAEANLQPNQSIPLYADGVIQSLIVGELKDPIPVYLDASTGEETFIHSGAQITLDENGAILTIK